MGFSVRRHFGILDTDPDARVMARRHERNDVTSYAEISPNEPDVMPDYVDEKPPSKSPRKATGTKVAARKAEPSATGEANMRKPDTIQSSVEPLRDAPVNAAFKRNESIFDAIGEEKTYSAAGTPTIQSDISREDVSAPEASAHREGECVPNVPDIGPDFVSPMEAAKLEAAEKTVEPLIDSTAEAAKPARSPWMRWYLVATVMVVSVFGMLVFSQAVSALSLARTLPVWAQYTLLIPLAFCCIAVLAVCGSLVHGWFRLREVRQIDIGALEELRSRAQSRQDGIEHFQEARNRLEEYLRRYPLTHDGQDNLVRSGIAPEKIEDLARTRHRLVGLSVDSRSWLDDFSVHFQADLDQAALARVNGWAVKAAGCVIASPLPLLDSALVLGISMKMMKDLCSIYNVRSTRTGSLVLLNKAVIAAFIAGVAEDATEVAGGLAAEELSQMVGESTLNSLGARMAGVVAPKLGEGAINAFFIRRLGKATIRMLQPLRPKSKRSRVK